MAVLTLDDELTRPAARKALRPTLRVRRHGDARERVIELASGKFTIGSSPQCQVCLPTAEVKPLQCLITVEGGSVLATRWSPGVLLNGKDFGKAALADGDRLVVGPWEIVFHAGEQSEARPVANEKESDLHVPATTAAGAPHWPPPKQPVPAPRPEARPAIQNLEEVHAEVASAEPASVEQIEPPLAWEVSAPAMALSSHAFADRLILDLWAANFRTRRRAKALLNGVRAARFQADALRADLAAMETELDLARAAYDSQAAHDAQLQLEIATHRRQVEQRLAPLLEEVAQLRLELGSAQAELGAQTAECERLTGQLAAHQLRDAPTPAELQSELRSKELEAALEAQQEQIEQLRQAYEAADYERQQLTELYRTEAERVTELERALAEQIEAATSNAAAVVEWPADGTDDSATVEPGTPLPLAEESVVPNAMDVWGAFSNISEPAPAPLAEPEAKPWAESESEVNAPAALMTPLIETAPPTAFTEVAPDNAEVGLPRKAFELSPQVAKAWQMAIEQPAPPPIVAAAPDLDLSPQAIASAPQADVVEAAPVPEYSTTSFIDKYRHLLDEEDAAAAPALSGSSRPLLDDEFLSPAKVETCATADEESDEALEAYMASMMQRVRSTSPTYTSSQAPAMEPTPASGLAHLLTGGSPVAAAELTADPSPGEQEPLDFESLRQASRRPAPATDLAALREIANTSARTAIASHSQRRSLESAVSRIVIGLTALLSSGYLMASAPEVNGWMFWAGAATGAVGITASVQVLLLERRRSAENRDAANGQPRATS